MSKTYFERVTENFERAVTQMQDNLQFLADKGSVSNRFIDIQNQVIKSLIDYHHYCQERISEHEMERFNTSLSISKLIDKHKQTTESFEAICIIHGIMDILPLMNKGNAYLVDEAVRLHKGGRFLMPMMMRELINKLPKEDKEIVEAHLYGNRLNAEHDEKIKELKRKLKELEDARTQRNKEEQSRYQQQAFDFTG